MKLNEILSDFNSSPVTREQGISYLMKKMVALNDQIKIKTQDWNEAIEAKKPYMYIYRLAQRVQDIKERLAHEQRTLEQLRNPGMSPRDIESIIRHNFMEASETIHKHKLWIDDLRNPPDDSFDVARSYDEAISMLSKYKYTDIWLDHDLGDFSGPNGRERSGYDVLMFLVQRKHEGEYVPLNFHILTANPVGRTKFEGVINRYLRS